MIEIEEVPDEIPEEEEAPSALGQCNEQDTTDNSKSTDGWERLMGEDLVMKVIDSSPPSNSKEPEAVNPQDAVLIDFVGRLAADKSVTDGPIFQQVKGCFIVVGEGDVLPSVEMAVRFMSTGQTALLWSHSKFAFGPGTRNYEGTIVPPNSNVLFEIKVHQIVMDTSRLNPYFTIQKALSRKTIANDIYQHEWCPPPVVDTDPTCETAMARAVRLYQKAAKEMETLLNGTYFQQVEQDHPQRHQSKQLMLDSLNNIVAVYLRQQEYHKAKLSAIEVLQQDKTNIKALLRAAKAALLDPASTYEEVKLALDAAEKEITYKHPHEEKELKKLKAQFKRKQSEYKEKTKAMFANKLTSNNLSGDDDDMPTTNDDNKTDQEGEDDSKKEETLVHEAEKDGTLDTATASTFKDKKTASPSKEKPEESDPNTDNNDTTGRDGFWKKQFFSILLQVILPIALFLLFRRIKTTHQIAEQTLHANQAAREIPHLMREQQVEEEHVETINLDDQPDL